MQKSTVRSLGIYTFAVLMILLRPYVAYQISARNGGLSKDPDQVSRILQRLVKKKESHIHDVEEAMELLQATDPKVILPVVLLALLRNRAAWLLALLKEAVSSYHLNTIFQVSPTNQYYQLISRLQI